MYSELWKTKTAVIYYSIEEKRSVASQEKENAEKRIRRL